MKMFKDLINKPVYYFVKQTEKDVTTGIIKISTIKNITVDVVKNEYSYHLGSDVFISKGDSLPKNLFLKEPTEKMVKDFMTECSRQSVKQLDYSIKNVQDKIDSLEKSLKFFNKKKRIIG